jgi:hypothetical protein
MTLMLILLETAHDLVERPGALWMPPPPAPGLMTALTLAKARLRCDSWFVPTPLDLRGRLLIGAARLVGRLQGLRLPWPRLCPPDDTLTLGR